ncbi:MAG: hypothetical protein CMJ18_12230 [Phycisphaeraceae bacterium]|nr:hypothetical protein [Phycisphaeraceae bacterium]
MSKQDRPWLQPVLVAASIVVLAIAVVVVFRSTAGNSRSVVGEAVLGCTACDYFYRSDNRRGPLNCPKCDARAAWPAMLCRKCNRVVGIDRMMMRREGISDATCPHCGSTDLRTIRSSESLEGF